LGKSQKEFAALLYEKFGLPVPTYKACEQGKLTLQPAMANALMVMVGVDPLSISSKTGFPKDLKGERYSPSNHNLISDRERGYTNEGLVDILSRLSDRYLVVLLAACQAERLTLAAACFEEAIDSALHGLDLSRNIVDIQGGKKDFSVWTGWRLALLGAPYKFPSEPLLPRGPEYKHALLKLVERVRNAGKS
jgi:hypothetical protein